MEAVMMVLALLLAVMVSWILARLLPVKLPLGYGREIYLWSVIVGLLIFALGAAASIYEAIAPIRHPEPIQNPAINHVVLALSFVFEGGSWWIALKQLSAIKDEPRLLQSRAPEQGSFLVHGPVRGQRGPDRHPDCRRWYVRIRDAGNAGVGRDFIITDWPRSRRHLGSARA